MLQLKNLGSQSLTKSQDGTTTKLIEVNRLTYILTNLVIRLNLTSLRKCNFLIFIFNFAISNNYTVALNLEVTLVRVHDDIKVFVTTKNLGKYITEALLQYTYQCSTVDILCFFKLAECINHTRCQFLLFFSHNLIETNYVFCIFYFIHLVNVINLLLNRTFFTFNLYLFFNANCEVISFNSFQDTLHLLAVGIVSPLR